MDKIIDQQEPDGKKPQQVYFPIVMSCTQMNYMLSHHNRDEVKCVNMKVRIHGQKDPMEITLHVKLSMQCDRDKIDKKEGHWWCFHGFCKELGGMVTGRYSTIFRQQGHLRKVSDAEQMLIHAALGYGDAVEDLEKMGFIIPKPKPYCKDCGFEIIPSEKNRNGQDCDTCGTMTFVLQPKSRETHKKPAADGQL